MTPTCPFATLPRLTAALGLTLICAAVGLGQTEVRVGYLPATHDSLLFIAKEMNLFGSGIAVRAKPYENSVQILSDLKSGILDIGIPGIATPAVDIGGRASLSIIGGAASKSAALVVQDALVGPMQAATTVDAKVQLLRGKRVGAVRGSTGLAIFRQALVAGKLDEKALELIQYSKPSEIVSALVAADLDAGLLWSPHMTLAEDRKLTIVFWMSEVLKDHVCCRQIARDDFLKNRDAVVDYLAGILRADAKLREARSNPALKPVLMNAVRKYLTTLTDPQLEREILADTPRTTLSPDLDRQGIDNYLKAMEVAGLMRPDQCDNVRAKVRSDLLEAAYARAGCSTKAAAACVSRPAAECGCVR